ncbi:hypothetical protein SCALM49S_09160 [Streptomyces californicus]
MTDGRGVTTNYTYDGRDRVTTQNAGSANATFTYDADGNLTTRTTPGGTSTFTYDEQNRERTRALPGTPATSITYDATGNVATAVDAAGTVSYRLRRRQPADLVTEPGGAKTGFTYDNNGDRTRTTFPGGTTQTVTSDDSGRPTKIEVKSGSTSLSTISYDYAGARAGPRQGPQAHHRRRRHRLHLRQPGPPDQGHRAPSPAPPGRLVLLLRQGRQPHRPLHRNVASVSNCDDAQQKAVHDNAGELTSFDGNDAFTYDGAGNETSAASPTGTRTADVDAAHPARRLHPVRHHHRPDLRRHRQHPAPEGRLHHLHQRRRRHHRAEHLRGGDRFRP